MAIDIVARKAKFFSESEHEAFINLVRSGGEVTDHTLQRNVPRAECLVFLRDCGRLQGVAALKNPISSYRQTILRKSGISLAEPNFPFELGYVFVAPEVRGKGYSRQLVDAAVRGAGARGVFATSRADNPAMHATLGKFGFERAGNEYAGRSESEKIQLFLRSAR